MSKHNKKTCTDCQQHATPWKTSVKLAWKMLRGDDHDWMPVSSTQPPPAASIRRIKKMVDKRITERDQRLREELGWRLGVLEAGYFVDMPRKKQDFPRWSFLCSLFDPIDRAYCAPPRIYIWTPWAHITIALGPHGTLNDGDWIVYHRRDSRRCETLTTLMKERDDTVFARYTTYNWCPLLKGHKGPHVHARTREPLERPAVILPPLPVDK